MHMHLISSTFTDLFQLRSVNLQISAQSGDDQVAIVVMVMLGAGAGTGDG